MITIFLIEDETPAILVLERAFQRSPLEVELVTAKTEADAISIAQSGQRFDWVLLDGKLNPGQGERVYPHLQLHRDRILGISSDDQLYLHHHFPKPGVLAAVAHIVAAELKSGQE